MSKSKLSYLGGHSLIFRGGRWSTIDPAESRNTKIPQVALEKRKPEADLPATTQVDRPAEVKRTNWQKHVHLAAVARVSGQPQPCLPKHLLRKLEKRKMADQFEADIHAEVFKLIVARGSKP
jgi:hypothetical protein